MEDNKNIKQLFQKFLKDDCTQSEIGQVVKYFQEAKQTEDFPTVEDVLELFHDLPDVDSEASNQIVHHIIKDYKPNHHIWRYVAAAVVIGLLAATYVFKDYLFTSSSQISKPIIVNNQIEPGTDKATLTLEDGSEIVLVKGQSVQTPNATSNGEEIVYQAGAQSRAIAFNTLTIPRGGQYNMVLADGTKVWLNSESQIRYPIAFNEGETRQVELIYGEAYFDVSPSTEHGGSHFKVLSTSPPFGGIKGGSQIVEVLGTQFNIKAYKDETNIYTTLVEGKVAVTPIIMSSRAQSRDLTPTQQSNLNIENGNITIATADVYRETAWKEGVFSFKDKSLKDIMKVLSRWYDMDVVIENKELENIIFIGSFNKNLSIEEILFSIKNTNVIKTYQINNKTIIIK